MKTGAQRSEVREVMDIRQASDYLGISADTLYKYASESFVPAFKLGNRWRFKKSLLDDWMSRQSSARMQMPVALKAAPSRVRKPPARAGRGADRSAAIGS